MIEFKPLSTEEKACLHAALRGNAETGAALRMDPRDTSFVGGDGAADIELDALVNAIKSVPCHYAGPWEIQILWAGVWVTVQRGFASRDDAEWATAEWKQANRCTGDPFRAVRDALADLPHRKEQTEDAHLRDLIRGRTDLG